MHAASKALERLYTCAVCIAIGLLILRAWVADSRESGPMRTAAGRILVR